MAAEERRVALVQAGLRVIANHGLSAATVRAIAAEAGVPLATFHYVFGSRDEMIGEAYRYAVEPRVGLPAAPFDPGASPHEAVQAVLQDWIDRFSRQPEEVLAVLEIMAHCKRTPSLAHLPAAVHARYLELIAGRIEALCAHIGVSPSRPVADIAAIVLHVTDGLTFSMLRTGDAAASAAFVDVIAPVLAELVVGPQ